MDCSAPALRCRQIGEADIAIVAALLKQGFPNRTRQFWRDALRRLAHREPPPGFPKYGFLLERGEVPVGAILMIYSTLLQGDRVATRCNLSSWYVAPEYRAYASLLVSHALSHKDVTYMNVSAAPHTWPIIEAQGFARYCEGIFIALSALKRSNEAVRILDATQTPKAPFEASDRDLLQRHAELGCISLWCENAERAHPFVFRPRLAKRIVPCAQLIYCSDVADLVHFAGPVGRYLARRGRPFVVIDSNGAIPGLFGRFQAGSMAKYFKGPQRPRLGDLAYTEYALLGV